MHRERQQQCIISSYCWTRALRSSPHRALVSCLLLLHSKRQKNNAISLWMAWPQTEQLRDDKRPIERGYALHRALRFTWLLLLRTITRTIPRERGLIEVTGRASEECVERTKHEREGLPGVRVRRSSHSRCAVALCAVWCSLPGLQTTALTVWVLDFVLQSQTSDLTLDADTF